MTINGAIIGIGGFLQAITFVIIKWKELKKAFKY